jgi:hypothetical protein
VNPGRCQELGNDKIPIYTSLAKVAIALGLMTSLIGGIAPRVTNADGKIDVTIRSEASVGLEFGDAKAERNTTTFAERTSGTKNSTDAELVKGEQTMTTINSDKNGVGKASSLPGE